MDQRTIICGDCLKEIVIPVGGMANKALMDHIRDAAHE